LEITLSKPLTDFQNFFTNGKKSKM